jgi:hypothetical protein
VRHSELSRFFEGAGLVSLKRHSFHFQRMGCSGARAAAYSCRSIADTQSRLIQDLGLNEMHLDCVCQDLVSFLTKDNVPEDGIGSAECPVQAS